MIKMEEMDVDAEEADPVMKEVDVYLSQSLAKYLYLLQYPLRPAHLPYKAENVLSARVCGGGEGVELDMRVRPRGQNYSTSRGEHCARMVALGVKGEGGKQPLYQSDLFDKFTLTSTPTPPRDSRYAAAVFKDGSLHITPLQGLVQLRPSLSYLDKFDVGTKFEISSTLSNDVDTTESEGEEAKPVTVRFARRENAVKSQKKFRHKLSYTEAMENHKSSRVWDNVSYYGVMSEEAKEERGLLFAEKDDQRGRFCLSEEKYLDSISLKKDYGEEVTGNGTSGLPIGVVSLEQIKTLPLKRQVLEVLRNAQMIQFGQLCSLLGVSGGKVAGVLEAVMGCAVLVQGCWVVSSHVVFPESNETAKRNARDYILWCFHQRRLVPRKDIMGVVRLPNEEVRQLMQSLANQRFIPQQGWEFKLESDLDFINRNGAVVTKEEVRWNKRYKDLVTEINMKSPATTKSSVETTPNDNGGKEGSGRKEGSGGSKEEKSHRKKKRQVVSSGHTSADVSDVNPFLTPSRPSSTYELTPQTIVMTKNAIPKLIDAIPIPTDSIPMDMDMPKDTMSTDTMPTDTIPMDMGSEVTVNSSGDEHMSPYHRPMLSPPLSSLVHQAMSNYPSINQSVQLDVPIKEEEPDSELLDAIIELCQDTIGRRVVSFNEIKDKLLLKQASLEEGHPLREQGVPDSLLDRGLRLCGAVEVGQPWDRRLFALPLDDECRAIILELYQKHKVLRKKQLVDMLADRKVTVPEKTLMKTLKELCSGKGGHWRLLGT